jgi:glycerol-3-phosphate dehydrogenase
LIAFEPELGEPLVAGQPYLRAEAVYAARHEMATTLDDVLLRRTRAHLFDRAATLDAAPAVAALLGRELRWSDAEIEAQLDAYRAICTREEEAADARVANATD